jgi:hypothetical protein
MNGSVAEGREAPALRQASNLPMKNLLLPRAIRHALRNHTAFLGFHVLPGKLAAVFAQSVTV